MRFRRIDVDVAGVSAVFSAIAETKAEADALGEYLAKAQVGTLPPQPSPTPPPPPPPISTIQPADILTTVSADLPFVQQGAQGVYVDCLGGSPGLQTYSETGKHGSKLPNNGETIRFGKELDPLNSARKALTFQLAPSDPITGGSHRVELGFPRNVEMNKVYWFGESVYVHDWGTLSQSDEAVFGFQLHSGSKRDLSPTIALNTAANGRAFRVSGRYSTSNDPNQNNSTGVALVAERPIPFGRWMDFVVKFKQNVGGQGFATVWLDGVQVADYRGPLGFNTPEAPKDFVKCGYYNWSSGFNSPRKVRLRSPTLVLDQTGSAYTPEMLRAFVNR